MCNNKCSCTRRDKEECVEESSSGKMCVKDMPIIEDINLSNTKLFDSGDYTADKLEYTCMKCLYKGSPKRYWKGGNYMIWYQGCAECGSGVFIQ